MVKPSEGCSPRFPHAPFFRTYLLFLGIVLGYLLGYLEAWSRLKELFSVEGLILIGVWLKLMVCYEMVSSVFLTSTLVL